MYVYIEPQRHPGCAVRRVAASRRSRCEEVDRNKKKTKSKKKSKKNNKTNNTTNNININSNSNSNHSNNGSSSNNNNNNNNDNNNNNNNNSPSCHVPGPRLSYDVSERKSHVNIS